MVTAACGGADNSESPATSVAPSPSLTDAGGSGDQTPIEAPDPTTSPPQTSGTPGPTPTELPDSDYPAIVVTDLAGGTVDLRELALGDKPTLVWFWAPH